MDDEIALPVVKYCEHQSSIDGCCLHPKNHTPECHIFICPLLNHERVDQLLESESE